MRKSVLVVAFGILFLILLTWFGTIITALVPHRTTAQIQTTHAGPYTITLRVDPNPPKITEPATITVQLQLTSSQQPVTNAHVTLESNMETMDMGTTRADTQTQSSGSYTTSVQFSMSGTWQVRVIITTAGAKPVSTTFEVTAQ